MLINVTVWSYFRDHAGCSETVVELEPAATLANLHEIVCEQFPKLADARNSTLKAVGLEYESDDFVLSDRDEVSFFPPVQGG